MTVAGMLVVVSFLGGSPAPDSTAIRAADSALRRAQMAATIQDALTRARAAAMDNQVRDFLRDSIVTKEVLPFLEAPFSIRAADVPTAAELRHAETLAEVVLKQGGNRFYPQVGSGGATAVPQINLGFPSEAALVSGLTNFLVERAKDEAVYAFVINLGKHAQSPLIKVGLPRSFSLISQVDTRTFQSFMPLLRTAFAEDLAELPRTVVTPAFADSMGWDEIPLSLQLTALGYDRGLALYRGGTPAVVLASLAEVEPDQVDDAELRLALRLAGLLAREYAASGGTDLIKGLLPGAYTLPRTYFTVFLVHDAADLGGVSDADRRQLMTHVETRLPDLMLFINQLHALATEAGATGGDGEVQPAFAGRALGALQLLETATRLVPMNGDDAEVIRTALQDVRRIHEALAQRDFTALVTWLVNAPQIAINAEQMKYVSFAAALASAETAEDVSTVLTTASSPVGSYRTKRSERVTASLTGYLGGRYGWENIDRVDDDVRAYGVALPVGPEVSMRTVIGAVSLFAPLIDLGNLATFTNDSQVSDAPEVGFEQLLSPGLFVVLNFGRSWPISAGFGVQSLRAYRNSDLQEKLNGVRTSFFLGVDATIFQTAF